MGVHGITSLLKSNGWLPSSTVDCRCSPALFREVNRTSNAAQNLLGLPSSSSSSSSPNASDAEPLLPSERNIPRGSTFWIDGNGLTFYLEAVAYARHVQNVLKRDPKLSRQVFGAPSNNSSSSSTTTTSSNATKCITTRILKSLSIKQINELLPHTLPLSLVDEVVKEYVQTLRNDCGIQLKVVWDGPMRRPQKDATMEKRRGQMDEEWCTLQQYCESGTVPSGHGRQSCLCSCWKSKLPRARLTTSQVRHSLRAAGVEMLTSDEEADLYLAQQATDDKTAFVVGQDSDFFFFRGMQYIPMDTITLDRRSSQVSACVFERSVLADEVLGFATERHMLELVYLSGNDYLDGMPFQKKYLNGSGHSNAIEFLQHQDEDFRVEATSLTQYSEEDILDMARTMEFIKAWYELDDLDDFTVESVLEQVEADVFDESSAVRRIEDGGTFDDNTRAVSTDNNDDKDHNESDTNIPDSDDPNAIVISLPDDFPRDLATATGMDRSLSSVVYRCVKTYLVQNGGTHLLNEQHVAAYQALMCNSDGTALKSIKANCPNKLPSWRDIQACVIIEACIAYTLKVKKNRLLAAASSPHALIDCFAFHSCMAQQREQTDEQKKAAADGTSSNNNQDETQQQQPQQFSQDQTDAEASGGEPETPPKRIVLPIDAHEESILQHIKDNRITIIHGETGCGKSSRLPIMLLRAPPPDPAIGKVKFFISQPRRIAAKSLTERVRSCEPEFKDRFALRMGHGWKEYESSKTQAWFVTTGYLTRLMANHPERFDKCSHLIIDEVHERSVDTDILCLLCKRLLKRNHTIRLVLMSATLAASMYQEYFEVDNPPIHVGVRTFPIRQFFLEDLNGLARLSSQEQQAVNSISKECQKQRCQAAPNTAGIKHRVVLAARLATVVGCRGGSVLIFVPGMGEIVAITEAVENFHIAGTTFTCFPIHSDIPFEEQMLAFDKPEEDEVKIIIATNAAESSVTLPAVDHVICLGLCRQIVYNPRSHRQMLVPCWISRASATQRAGRTGRVRPGNVYRLYTKDAYEHYMQPFEPGEMVRIPLDSIILMLKEMLHEEIKPVLLSCIEPPAIDTIDRSFESLHKNNFITEPNDAADITTLGTFVSSAGVDLTLGSIIGLGIQFGVAAEAIELAAAMAFPKSPFRIATAMFHEPDEFNKITKESYIAKCHFDANLYSEPLGLMNLMWDHDQARNKSAWCRKFSVVPTRINQLMSTRKNLRQRTADFFGINEDKLRVLAPPVHMPHAKITILRLLQVWVFSETMIESSSTPVQRQPDGSVRVKIKGTAISHHEMEQIVDPVRHPFQLSNEASIHQFGTFDPEYSLVGNMHGFVKEFEPKVLSYAMECGYGTTIVQTEDFLNVYFDMSNSAGPSVIKAFRDDFAARYGLLESDSIFMSRREGNKLHGIQERKSGSWKMHERSEIDGDRAASDSSGKQICKFVASSDADYIAHELTPFLASIFQGATMTWKFTKKTSKKQKKAGKLPFQVAMQGDCKEISKIDLQDLLGTSEFVSRKGRSNSSQSLVFANSNNRPMEYKSMDKATQATIYDGPQTSWARPMMKDVPEGLRLLAVVASEPRSGKPRRHHVKVFPKAQPDDWVVFSPEEDLTDLRERWAQIGTTRNVYVDKSTVPASATHDSQMLFCCCSNTLEVNGGGQRVEGMTLLPPVRLFVLLSALTFGVESDLFGFRGFEESRMSQDTADSELAAWLDGMCETKLTEEQLADAEDRIGKARAFNKSCTDMGEELFTFTDKLRELCEIFDMVDGYSVRLWDQLDATCLSRENLKKWQHERKCRAAEADHNGGDKHGSINLSDNHRNPSAAAKVERDAQPRPEIMTSFPSAVLPNRSRMFATSLPAGEEVDPNELVSTNILALLTRVYFDMNRSVVGNGADKSGVSSDSSTDGAAFEKQYLDVASKNWKIIKGLDDEGTEWFHAQFTNSIVPDRPLAGRGKNRVPRWVKRHIRPQQPADANGCIPPLLTMPEPVRIKIGHNSQRLAYRDMETAMRMEAAFWLERYFCCATKTTVRHWYDFTFPQMVGIVRRVIDSDEKKQ
eukprot:CAMPEP_0119572152 /NCGR_PEP_ID=MMETSP1352-20130426/44476_1 /TAXON_ID=265584 /ORGANISM="Stauroneis constricta, Strain CCMP1120" /LENGTH=2052 /DNA_ID=CAMNT_0007621837 /DNA_START=51 /DNA_END=6209 /DNA_ORIENTATION=-